MLFYEEDATFSTKKLKASVFVQTEIQRLQLWLLMNCLTKQSNVNAHESFTGGTPNLNCVFTARI